MHISPYSRAPISVLYVRCGTAHRFTVFWFTVALRVAAVIVKESHILSRVSAEGPLSDSPAGRNTGVVRSSTRVRPYATPPVGTRHTYLQLGWGLDGSLCLV